MPELFYFRSDTVVVFHFASSQNILSSDTGTLILRLALHHSQHDRFTTARPPLFARSTGRARSFSTDQLSYLVLYFFSSFFFFFLFISTMNNPSDLLCRYFFSFSVRTFVSCFFSVSFLCEKEKIYYFPRESTCWLIPLGIEAVISVFLAKILNASLRHCNVTCHSVSEIISSTRICRYICVFLIE